MTESLSLYFSSDISSVPTHISHTVRDHVNVGQQIGTGISDN